MQLLESCRATLPGSVPLLLEVIFTLAQDEWPQVRYGEGGGGGRMIWVCSA